ncbi:unnamed protein product [Paramecium sonneborni]|uniref:Uncharacterized protein n=1 Tax=Paramecium sonneborni TaxID=65129 RepID=A0A8S1LG87_9CILI|nr:unnamed protein product [Paramecium sonneborni]
MGICSSKTKNPQTNQQQQYSKNQTHQNQTPNQQIIEIPEQRTQKIEEQKQIIKITEQAPIVQTQQQQENEKIDMFPLSKEEFDQFKDDICIKNIHKSFDDIDKILNKLTEELDKISQYFLTGTDYEALRR